MLDRPNGFVQPQKDRRGVDMPLWGKGVVIAGVVAVLVAIALSLPHLSHWLLEH